MTDPNVFIDTWRNSESVGEVAEKLSISTATASKVAWALRSLGHDLPSKFNPVRIGSQGGRPKKVQNE